MRKRCLRRLFGAGLMVGFLVSFAPPGRLCHGLARKITENTTLTAAASPYTGFTTIESAATLTIEPGVVLKLSNMTVKGTLDVEGTS